MQEASPIVQLQCENPACRRIVKVKRPSRPGSYKLSCPDCGWKISLVVPTAAPAQGPVHPHLDPPPPPQQIPNNALQPPREDRGDYKEGETATIECGFHCGYVHHEVPSQTGENIFMCPRCKGRTKYQARGKTITIDPGLFQAYRGKLILLRSGWFNKEFRLSAGSNVIGRFDTDPMGNSDIAIKDDPSMSRRSIDIQVTRSEINGYMFQLNVLRATNPVLINHMPVGPGESISLNFGDSIILGKTQFRFEKDV